MDTRLLLASKCQRNPFNGTPNKRCLLPPLCASEASAQGNFEAGALLCTVPSPPRRAEPAPCRSVNPITQEKTSPKPETST